MIGEKSSETYIPDERLEQIGHIATEVWQGRHGAARVIEAALRERALSSLVWEFDSAINSLNERWLTNPSADLSNFWNIRSLDYFLSSKQTELPRLQPYGGQAGTRAYIQTLREMSPLMERAEQAEPEPKLTFAANEQLTEQQALLGGTIQVAGRYLAKRLGENPERLVPVWLGGMKATDMELSSLIMDALLEVPLANGKPAHYDYFTTA